MRIKLFVIIILLFFNCSSISVAREDFTKVNNFNEWSEAEKEIYKLLFYDNPIPNEDIWNIASIRCDMLIDEGVNISHGGYPFVSEYLRQVGFSEVSEIVAYGYSTPEGVVKSWLNSESHYKVIKGEYKYLGISAKEKYYVIIFCN